MHGYDWVALREQYKPLLQYVAHRSDLNYVISEMISELTIQHAYIEGGDFTIPPRPRGGLPGARIGRRQRGLNGPSADHLHAAGLRPGRSAEADVHDDARRLRRARHHARDHQMTPPQPHARQARSRRSF